MYAIQSVLPSTFRGLWWMNVCICQSQYKVNTHMGKVLDGWTSLWLNFLTISERPYGHISLWMNAHMGWHFCGMFYGWKANIGKYSVNVHMGDVFMGEYILIEPNFMSVRMHMCKRECLSGWLFIWKSVFLLVSSRMDECLYGWFIV